MAKFGPPKSKGFSNPAAPRVLTSQEAENVLTTTCRPEDDENTIDSEEQNEQDIIDEVFGTDGEDETTDDDAEGEPSDDVEDKPTKPATVAAKGTKKAGGNLSAEQQKYWDEIGKLGIDQGKGVSSLIFLAEKCVSIGANGVFETTQLKDLYLHFRKNTTLLLARMPRLVNRIILLSPIRPSSALSTRLVRSMVWPVGAKCSRWLATFMCKSCVPRMSVSCCVVSSWCRLTRLSLRSHLLK